MDKKQTPVKHIFNKPNKREIAHFFHKYMFPTFPSDNSYVDYKPGEASRTI